MVISPAFQRWVGETKIPRSPVGTTRNPPKTRVPRNEFSDEIGGGRAAAGAAAELAQAGGCAAAGERECLRSRNRQASRRGRQRRRRHWGGNRRAREPGAMRRRCERGRGAGGCLFRRHHRAVVRAVAAAAGRQARFLAGWKQYRERSQPEEQNQQDANNSPHSGLILPKLSRLRHMGNGMPCSSMIGALSCFYHACEGNHFVQSQ